MIDTKELRRLAQAANAEPDGDVMSWIEGMQRLQGALLPDDVLELLDRLEAAESSAAWHQRRWMALQMHQKKMREPERTIVCDILANGELMHPTIAGDRYATKDAMEESK